MHLLSPDGSVAVQCLLSMQALNPHFFVDFGAEPGGPVLAHEMR